ncbi:MAG TPA: hypothetical protein VF321_00070 [Gaiellaceae bacterium]
MKPQLRTRFWIESALAGASAFLFALTLVWKDWIEAIFGVDPDHSSGAIEWAIVAALLVVTLVATLLARAERRRAYRGASVAST